MQVNNAGIIGAIIDGDALAVSGIGEVSFVSRIFFLSLLYKKDWYGDTVERALLVRSMVKTFSCYKLCDQIE